MLHYPLRGEVGRCDVAVGLCRAHRLKSGTLRRAVVREQLTQHCMGGWRTCLFTDGTQGHELRKATVRLDAKGTDTFANVINCPRKLGVLLLKHRMQRFELRAHNIPMKALSLQVENVAICEQAPQRSGRFCSCNLIVDVGIWHVLLPVLCLLRISPQLDNVLRWQKVSGTSNFDELE